MRVEHRCPTCAPSAFRPEGRDPNELRQARGLLTLTCACGEATTISTTLAPGRQLTRLGWTVRFVET